MEKNNQEYNRLELMLLANKDYNFMDFQPYKNKNLYILSGIDFILYNIQPKEAQKMELIRRVVTNRIQIEKPDGDNKGYFDDTGFGNYASYDDLVVFKFLHVEKNKEHLAIPFTYFESYDGVEKFGYMYDGTILNATDTAKYIEELEKEKHRKLLEEMATISFTPIKDFGDIFRSMNINDFLEDNFGKPETVEDVNEKFRELSKVHHPDAGGDELMFQAIANGKQYLKDALNYEKGKLPVLA